MQQPARLASTAARTTPAPQRSGPRLSKTLWACLILLPGSACFYSVCFAVATVGGGSMTPTLNPQWPQLGVSAPQDWVILNRFKSFTQNWKTGDIVVFISPHNPTHLYTKRLVGLPGDVVRYQEKHKVTTPRGTVKEVARWARIRIPPGHCWVESDSSAMSAAGTKRSPAGLPDLSQDSRHFGPIPMGLLTAKVSYIIWPLNRIGRPAPRPDLPGTTSYKPGEPGLKRGWWPFGGSTDIDKGKRVEEDSPFTPYLEQVAVGATTGGVRRAVFVDSIDARDEHQDSSDTVIVDIPEKKKRILHKNTPLDQMSPEERERVVGYFNSLSRGGSLGHFIGSDEDGEQRAAGR